MEFHQERIENAGKTLNPKCPAEGYPSPKILAHMYQFLLASHSSAAQLPILCHVFFSVLMFVLKIYIWFKCCWVQRPWLPIKGLKLWRLDNTISEFRAYVHCACAETPIYELPVKIWPRHSLRRPLFPVTETDLSLRIHVHYVLEISLVYWNISMLKRFLAAKLFPKMAVFRKFEGLNIKYSHRDPQKALSYQERRHLTYFA